MGLTNFFKKAQVVAESYRAPEQGSSNHAHNKSLSSALDEEDTLLQPEPASDSWMAEIDEADLMLEHLFEIAEGNDWFDIDEEEHNIQLMTIRSSVNTYVSRPLGDEQTALEFVSQGLNCDGALLMCTEATRVLIDSTPPMAKSIVLGGEVNKLVDNVLPFPAYDIMQVRGICFIKELGAAIIWNDDASKLIDYARLWDERITKLVYSEKDKLINHSVFTSSEENEKGAANVLESKVGDEEIGRMAPGREAQLMWPITVALTFIIMGLLVGVVLKSVVEEVIESGQYVHLAYVLYIPLVCILTAFFLSIIAASVLQIIGPITHLQSNSKFYSYTRPTTTIARKDLPHITIHCPVYKEDLWDVIDPTIQSCRAAIATYEAQGGTANLMVADDGGQLRSEEEQKLRMQYYSVNNVSWTARRPHKKDGYLRRGLFKKASNLNHGLNLAAEVEDEYQRNKTEDGLVEEYDTARETVLSRRQYVDQCGGDLTVGSLMLIIDSDTRVPVDCILDAVLEFRDSPDLGIIQHTAQALIVSGDFFEHGMAHFIHMVFFGIRYNVAGGDLCPFLGHNAFLRWNAIREVSPIAGEYDVRYWSEEHVSEDFELALRMQTAGYSTRMATYDDNEWLEGVSITVYDEISRWTKYAWGCSELMFNPFKLWFKKGPFTSTISQFLGSKRVPLSAKCSSLFYMWTYWIIGMTWIYSAVNYFVFGWAANAVDRAYVNQFGILVAVAVIFGLHDLIVLPIARYRLREITLWRGSIESLKNFWIPIFFFQGMSIHVGRALFQHLIGREMSWGSTAKSVSSRTLVEEVPFIWRKYRVVFGICFTFVIIMIVLGVAVPALYKIDSIIAIFPLAWLVAFHVLNPFLLNAQSYLSELFTWL